jgi:hypothetical protein
MKSKAWLRAEKSVRNQADIKKAFFAAKREKNSETNNKIQ